MNDDIFISQIKYVKELVKKFDLANYKTTNTLMITHANLGVDEGGKSTGIYQYRAMIGSIIYLTASGLNIIYFIYLCVWYQVNLSDSHLITLRRILMYVRGTLNIRI
jgi:hypothetical protein